MAKKTTSVTSTGKPVSGAKSEQYAQSAVMMKQKAQRDRERAEAARKKAQGSAQSSGTGSDADALKTIAAAVAAGIAGSATARKKGSRLKTILILMLVAVVVIAGAYVYFKYIKPASGAPLLTIGEGLTSTTVDFQSSILGESRDKGMYVVFEQDAAVDTTVSQTVLDWAIFAKTKTIHSTGTGYYGVDLSALSADDVTTDEAKKTISVRIPHAVLYTIQYDLAKSTFDDTEKGLLALGDLTLTLEQTNEIEQSIDATLRAELGKAALMERADELALLQVRELFQPIVTAASSSYFVEVEFQEENDTNG